LKKDAESLKGVIKWAEQKMSLQSKEFNTLNSLAWIEGSIAFAQENYELAQHHFTNFYNSAINTDIPESILDYVIGKVT